MKAIDVLESEEFKKCLEFHGHLCPGLAIGFRAARAGLGRLSEYRSVDEEIVAIVENDSCSCDAIQVLTGCTFGKGNFIFKDHGKQAFILIARESGKAVRVALLDKALEVSPEHRELRLKISRDEASEAEQKEFRDLQRRKIHEILEKPEEELFSIKPVDVKAPPKARIFPSIPCDICGEPTMISRLKKVGSENVCMDCLVGNG
jgi:formylmethanofuran dehydrogenase subunit E